MKPQIKPTAMPCTEEQWLNEIKPLCDKHGLRYGCVEAFYGNPILVNNWAGDLGDITNLPEHNTNDKGRTLIPYHPELFMYNSGIFPEKWCVRGSSKFKGFCEKMGWDLSSVDGTFKDHFYYLDSENEIHTDYNQETMPSADYVEVTLEELMFHYEQKNDMKKVKCTNKSGIHYSVKDRITIGREYEILEESKDGFAWIIFDDKGIKASYHKDFFGGATHIHPTLKLTITRTELLEIHSIACPTWQTSIEGYGKRLDLVTDTITFTESEVNEMFKAATTYNGVNQKEVLERIFGNPEKARLIAEKEELKKRIEEIDRKNNLYTQKQLIQAMQTYATQSNINPIEVGTDGIKNGARLCKWYLEWFENKKNNGVELFGVDYELADSANKFLNATQSNAEATKKTAEESEYKLKTNEELIEIICDFGDGVTEFHTRDIERLLREVKGNAEAKGEYSIEKQHDGTYKLYLGRNDQQHGLWICSFSEFDINKEATIKAILNGLNNAEAMREHAIGFGKFIDKNKFHIENVTNLWISPMGNYSGCAYNNKELHAEYLTTLTK